MGTPDLGRLWAEWVTVWGLVLMGMRVSETVTVSGDGDFPWWVTLHKKRCRGTRVDCCS